MSAEPCPGDTAGDRGHESHSPWSCCRFHLAATRGNVDCLEAMLAHGVDAMTKDSSGEGMATMCPWASGCPQVLRLRGQRW